MKFGEVEKIHKKLCKEARSLSRKKGHDYSGDGDTLNNLKNTEKVGICKAEKGVLVRVQDKISRLSSLFNTDERKVKDESVKDTILDVINYMILLRSLMVEKKEEEDEVIHLDGKKLKQKQFFEEPDSMVRGD